MQRIVMMSALVFLAACGGGRVSGDVGKACMAADRKAASAQLCSCVQQAANRTLNASEQRRAASFFEEPQDAQDTRQSKSNSDNQFWDRYKRFSATAEQMCR